MTAPPPSVIARVQSVIERVTGPGRTPPHVGPDTPLGDGVWLDSIELVNVTVGCEEEFGIVFDALPRGTFHTLGTLAAAVQARLTAHA